MTLGWWLELPLLLTAATQMREREREPDVPPQDFMPDAVPVATLPIYPGLGPAHKLCWIAHSGAWFVPVN